MCFFNCPHLLIRFFKKSCSGHIQPRQGTEICNIGAPSPLDFFSLSPVEFSLFSRFTVQFSKEMAPKMWRKLPGFQAERKKRRILSRLWLLWFSRSRRVLCMPLIFLPLRSYYCGQNYYKNYSRERQRGGKKAGGGGGQNLTRRSPTENSFRPPHLGTFCPPPILFLS